MTDMPACRSRRLTVAGCDLHLIDDGDGPALLFLHGNPTSSFLYRHLIARLRGRFRCLAPDLPGFGGSRAAAGFDFRPAAHARVVAALIEALDLREARLMVHDWGGPIGLWAAARQPWRWRGLVIGNTWAWPVNGDLHFEWFARLMGGPLGRLAIHRWNAFVELLIPAGVVRPLPAEVMAAYRAPFADPAARRPTAVFPREILASAAWLAEVERGLPALAGLPALIVWGGRDIAFRRRECERFERLFAAHRTLHLPEAGHFIQEDAPDAIAEAILATCPATAPAAIAHSQAKEMR